MIKSVIFDLDGTLVDTITDLGNAVDKIMLHYGIVSSYTADDYKQMVGDGAKVLMERALKGVDLDAENDNVAKMFKDIYGKTLFNNSKPYDGIMEVVKTLKEKGFKLAVVSNKPDVNAQQMVNHFFSVGTFDIISGQQDGVPTKPHPAQVEKALSAMGSTNDETVFVGDSNTDIKTAKNAKMTSIGVNWGFRGEEELLKEGANFIAHESFDILSIIEKING